MKKIMIILSILFWQLQAYAGTGNLPVAVQYFETNESLPVAFVHEDSIPIVVMELGFHAGSGYDGAYPGLANLVAHCLGEGTPNRDGNQIAESLDSTGAELSVRVTPDLSLITMHSQSDPIDLNAALSSLVPAVAHLTISQEVLNQEQDKQFEALQLAQEDPEFLAQSALMRILFAETPYQYPVLGTANGIQAISLQNVQDFYQKYYQDQNGFLVIVGKIDLSAAKAVAETFSQALPMGSPAPALVVNLKTPNVTQVHIPFHSKQSMVWIGQVGLPAKNSQELALLLGNIILGGPTLESLLFNASKSESNNGFYLTGAGYKGYQASGLFWMKAQTEPNNLQNLISTMQTLFSNLSQQGPASQDFQNAKNFLTGSFQLEFASDQSVADLLVYLMAYGYPTDYLSLQSQNLLLLTQSDVKTALQKINTLGPSVVVTVGGEDANSESES